MNRRTMSSRSTGARSASNGYGNAGRVAYVAQDMGTEQYHEPPAELPAEVRTFARMCTSLIEEAEAIGWYQQRLALEADEQAAAIMRDAQQEEFNHFSMDLEFLLRRTPLWREIAKRVLFQTGEITERAEVAEEEVIHGEGESQADSADGGSLGIGSLKGREP
jgi:hypothetical protein